MPIAPDIEDEPPGLNPSSEEECHDSDDSSTSRVFLPGGNSMRESGTGIVKPNTPDQRKILCPSTIEETAIAVCRSAFSESDDIDHHPPIGSVVSSLSSIDDGSCKGTIHRTLASRNPRSMQPGIDGD